MAIRKNEKGGMLPPSNKRRIADLLLAERLGLEGDWMDPDFITDLPARLPQNANPKLPREDVNAIEGSIGRLVKFGCNRKVLYWCIRQMGAEANHFREGEKAITVLNDNEAPREERPVKASIATREDMAGLINKLKAASRALRQHRPELLLVADACADSHPLPSGMVTGPAPDAGESMVVLLDSLSWAKRLAQSFYSPNVMTLVKSKGILFLLAYVWLHSQQLPGQGASKRLPRQAADNIAHIAYLYCRVDWSAGDVNDKLQDFHQKQPNLFRKMVSRLEDLDRQSIAEPKGK
jgi:hypothetical protein